MTRKFSSLFFENPSFFALFGYFGFVEKKASGKDFNLDIF
jgi:hypothetical protein